MSWATGSLLAILMSVAGPAWSQEAGESARKAEAKTLLSQGAEAYANGDYESAWLHFVHAHELVPSPKIYFNIGQALLKMGRRAEAAEAFDSFLVSTATDPKTDFTKKQEASESLDKLSKELAKVSLEVTPENAQVTVDERRVVPGAVYLLLEPSEHVFEASASGFQTQRSTVVTTAAGKMGTVVRLHLIQGGAAPSPTVVSVPKPLPAPTPTSKPAPSPAITAAPIVSPPPPTATTSPPPKTAIVVDVPPQGKGPSSTTLVAQTVSAPTSNPPAAAVAKTDEPSRLPAYITWGAAGLLAVGGVVYGIKALNLGKSIGQSDGGLGQCDHSTAANYSSSCGEWNTDATLADVFWVGAGVAAAGGTALFVLAPTFGVSGSGGEVGVVGRF